MKNIEKEYCEPTLESFHLSEKSKSALILAARAFQLNLDELVDKAMRDVAYRECETERPCAYCFYSPQK